MQPDRKSKMIVKPQFRRPMIPPEHGRERVRLPDLSIPFLPEQFPGVAPLRFPGLIYLALILAGNAPRTVTALTEETKLPTKWVREHLAVGQGVGIFTKTREAHNRGVWRLVQFSPGGNLSPIRKSNTIKPITVKVVQVENILKKVPGAPPKPPIPKPPVSCEDPASVLRLTELWLAAFHIANGARSYRRSLSSTSRHWESEDPKVLRRWADAVRLDARLTEASIDPAEFCTAVAEHFAWCTRAAGRPIKTSMRQVSGPYGRDIWTRWRKRRMAEGGERAADQEKRVEAAAVNGTMPEAKRITQAVRWAWEECLRDGADWAMTSLWAPEVLWLLATTECAALPAVQAVLRYDGEQAKRARDGIALIRGNPGRQSWLMRLRREALGTTRPLLPWEDARRFPERRVGKPVDAIPELDEQVEE